MLGRATPVSQALPPGLVLWVKPTHVEGTQYDDTAASPTETVAQFKRRWLAEAKLDCDPSLVTLLLVKCGPDKLTKVPAERDAAEAAAATLYPEDTLVEAGVVDGSWLVAVFASAVAAASKALDALHISVDDAPSSFSDSRVCAKYQQRSGGPTFECFRPFVGPPLALPASLVSPIFAQFLDDCNADLASVGRCDLESNCAMALLAVMPEFFKSTSCCTRRATRRALTRRCASSFRGGDTGARCTQPGQARGTRRHCTRCAPCQAA